jgi:hypothetical protein
MIYDKDRYFVLLLNRHSLKKLSVLLSTLKLYSVAQQKMLVSKNKKTVQNHCTVFKLIQQTAVISLVLFPPSNNGLE